MPSSLKSRLHRYWPVGVMLLGGFAISGALGWVLYRDAVEQDEARFDSEARQVALALEQGVERYEERLARLADYCALFEEMPTRIWSFRSQTMTDLVGNLPNVMHAVYCPKVHATNFQAHLERGARAWGQAYRFDAEARSGRDYALPVWQGYSRSGFVPIERGTDMAQETNWHPSLHASLATARGWVSATPMRVARTDGTTESGFWFASTLFLADQKTLVGKLKGETVEEMNWRHGESRRRAATGTLAVFISADRMLDRAYNLRKTDRVGDRIDVPVPSTPGSTVTARLHARLYASREPSPATLLNTLSRPPEKPRHRRVIVQAWYRRKWALELTSTPLFEADSRRVHAWMALASGSGMTLLAGGLLGVSLRARQRQEHMTAEVLEARDALTVAEQERERLGHDLHDGAIQSLYAIQLGLTRTGDSVATTLPGASQVLTETRQRLDDVIAELRRFIMAREEPGGADGHIGLDSVLAAMVQRLQPTTSAQLKLEAQAGVADRLSVKQVVHLTQLARTAVANSLRHAEARQITISLREQDGKVRLEIVDDGVGFDTSKGSNGGLGLRTMRTRATEAGGTIEVDSRPGAGTRVVVTVTG